MEKEFKGATIGDPADLTIVSANQSIPDFGSYDNFDYNKLYPDYYITLEEKK